MSAGLWFFFWPPPDWPPGTPTEPPAPEPEVRPGAGGGGWQLDSDFWDVRERYLRRMFPVEQPALAPPRPLADTPDPLPVPAELLELEAERARIYAAAQRATTEAQLAKMEKRVVVVTERINKLLAEQDDEHVLSSLIPYLFL